MRSKRIRHGDGHHRRVERFIGPSGQWRMLAHEKVSRISYSEGVKGVASEVTYRCWELGDGRIYVETTRGAIAETLARVFQNRAEWEQWWNADLRAA